LTKGHVRVSTDPLNKGQTTVAPEGTTASPLWLEASQINVAVKVDHAKLKDLYIDTYAL
jgi:hypothetical protein